MWELQTATTPIPQTEWFAPPTADRTRRFLVDSERRVILHCKKLLGEPDLPFEERRRLTRLLNEAEARLQGFASQRQPKINSGKSSQKFFWETP